jgi:putative MATE family efflux protein
MTELTKTPGRLGRFRKLVWSALIGEERDYTTGSIRLAVILLAIPMILEMCGESVFAVVDMFFVGKLGKEALATVLLTESVLSIIYSIAMGMSMAATALVARRVGEKNYGEAAHAGMQVILLAVVLSIILAVVGVSFAESILRAMGATPRMIAENIQYTKIMYGGNIVIMLLFLINGIFRGAGDAAIAMHSLLISNAFNIVLCPLLIYGFGPIPGLGIKGAAIATTIGRGIGVLYQMYRLFFRQGMLHFYAAQLKPHAELLWQTIKVGSTGAIQFLVTSGSWMFLAKLMSGFGVAPMAGYQVAIRLLIFFLLPAWGMSNAAATLVGQNLGAGQPERAEKSVWITAGYVTAFMLFVTLICYLFGDPIVSLVNKDVEVRQYATQTLRIVSLGYIFFGVEMVMLNAFNGAGDTRTPTAVYFVGYWIFQIPLAWWLSQHYIREPKGVFFAIVISQFVTTVLAYYLFKRGRWKKVRV